MRKPDGLDEFTRLPQARLSLLSLPTAQPEMTPRPPTSSRSTIPTPSTAEAHTPTPSLTEKTKRISPRKPQPGSIREIREALSERADFGNAQTSSLIRVKPEKEEREFGYSLKKGDGSVTGLNRMKNRRASLAV